MQSFDFLGDQVMTGFLAGEHQEFAGGAVDQTAFLDLFLTGDFTHLRCRGSELKLSDGGFDARFRNSSIPGPLDGGFPAQIDLLRRERNQRTKLPFIVNPSCRTCGERASISTTAAEVFRTELQGTSRRGTVPVVRR